MEKENPVSPLNRKAKHKYKKIHHKHKERKERGIVDVLVYLD